MIAVAGWCAPIAKYFPAMVGTATKVLSVDFSTYRPQGSKRLGSRYRSGRSPDWRKFKNPAAPAVKRGALRSQQARDPTHRQPPGDAGPRQGRVRGELEAMEGVGPRWKRWNECQTTEFCICRGKLLCCRGVLPKAA